MLRQHRHHDGGGRQGESAADHGRRARLLPEQHRRRADHHRRNADLQRAEPEHEPAQRLQALVGQFETNREKQKHHAEFGDMLGAFGI